MVLDGGPALIRNYDCDYRLFEAVVARTAYTGHRVLGMLDCLWRLLDGVNDAGLAVSGRVEWEPYAAAIRTVERMERLKQLLADRADVSGMVDACLRPPLYATRFHEGFGTLYTAEYRPPEGAVHYHWPGRAWTQSLDTYDPDTIQIRLGAP